MLKGQLFAAMTALEKKLYLYLGELLDERETGSDLDPARQGWIPYYPALYSIESFTTMSIPDP